MKTIQDGVERLLPMRTRKLVWSSSMSVKYPPDLFINVALRLLSLHAASCSSERNWSLWLGLSAGTAAAALSLSSLRGYAFDCLSVQTRLKPPRA